MLLRIYEKTALKTASWASFALNKTLNKTCYKSVPQNQFHNYLISKISSFSIEKLHLTYFPSVSMHFITLFLNLVQNMPTYIN